MRNLKVTGTLAVVTTITLVGLFFRLYHIEFGLPHSFYADEPEVVELAIKYTYEFRDIFFNGNYSKLIPISYVYGTFPSYFYTVATVIFSKTNGLLGITFEKMDLYVFMRGINAFLSMGIALLCGLLYNKVFKDRRGAIITLFLLALNWKFIVHAHYVNNDLFQTFFIVLSFMFAYKFVDEKTTAKWLVIMGVVYGLAVGTKVTTLITLPLYLYLISQKEDAFKNLLLFCSTVFLTYLITNPFSFIFATDFTLRTLDMFTKEGGMVFDSVDSTPFKYIIALGYMLTVPVLMLSLYGIYSFYKQRLSFNKGTLLFLLFLFEHVLIYLVFFSLQSRRVDRWLMPILPISIIFASYGVKSLLDEIKKLPAFTTKLAIKLMFGLSLIFYLYFPLILLTQFQRNTPKSSAYLWAQQNIPELTWKLAYTEEGLDPLNKLKFADVKKFIVYTDEGAHLFYPENPELYDYIILASRPMENFSRPLVANAYPDYAQSWREFELTVLDREKFELIQAFVLPKPNLVPLSDVFIFKKLTPADRPAPVPLN